MAHKDGWTNTEIQKLFQAANTALFNLEKGLQDHPKQRGDEWISDIREDVYRVRNVLGYLENHTRARFNPTQRKAWEEFQKRVAIPIWALRGGKKPADRKSQGKASGPILENGNPSTE